MWSSFGSAPRGVCYLARQSCLGTLIAIVLWGSVARAQEGDNDGQAKLDEAIKLIETATTNKDFDSVGDLCEEAIDAGLSDESAELAKKTWANACLKYAQLHGEKVFVTPADARWKFLRQQALTRLEKAVELVPELTDAQLLITQFNLLPGGDKDAAQEALAKAFENSGDNPGQQAMAMVLRAQSADNAEQKMTDLNKALEVDPDNELALSLRGDLYFEQGKTDEAIADYRKLAEKQGNNSSTLMLLADRLTQSGKFDDAVATIDQALAINPESADAWLLRAQANLSNEKDEEAEADCTRALELDPRNLLALQLRASAKLSLEKYEDALKDVEKVLTFQHNSVAAINLRAMIYAAMEKYEPAIEDMQLLVDNFPDNPGFKTMLGIFYNASDRPSKAIEIYDELLAENSESAPILRSRGDAYLSRGDHKPAIDDYEAALKLDEDDDGILNNLAWVLATSPDAELRNGSRALVLAIKAAELTEYKQAHILSTLAASYAESGDFENAVKWSEKALELAAPGRQATDLARELETLKKGEPIRERETVEDENKNDEEKTDDDGTDGDSTEDKKPDDDPSEEDDGDGI